MPRNRRHAATSRSLIATAGIKRRKTAPKTEPKTAAQPSAPRASQRTKFVSSRARIPRALSGGAIGQMNRA